MSLNSSDRRAAAMPRDRAAGALRYGGIGPAVRSPHRRLAAVVLALVSLAAAAADAPPAAGTPAPAGAGAGAGIPTLAELQAAGVRIGRITVRTDDIFDLDDPQENRALFRLANRLHIRTRPSVIEGLLLFRRGEPLRAAVVEETERRLQARRHLYAASVRVTAVHDGVADIEVRTRDTWSFEPGFSLGRAGGVGSSSLQLREYNLLGTGTVASVLRTRTVDRRSTEFVVAADRLGRSELAGSLSHAVNSDGHRTAVSLGLPFAGLDSPRAWGLRVLDDDRVDPLYRGGVEVERYRHRARELAVALARSDGRVDGYVERRSVGLALQDDAFAVEPGGAPPPPRLPEPQRLRYPYLRWELIEDRFEREENRNLVGRPEFFALGVQAHVQVGLSLRALGADDDRLLLAAGVSRGFEPAPGQRLLAALSASAQWRGGAPERQRWNAQAQYYVPQGPWRLFYAALSLDGQTEPRPDELLLLGGDNGLRGYPLRYQAGTRRALLTVEQRLYSDWYPWRLFRLGGAVFADVGRAWGGDRVNPDAPGWLGDVGVGLRIVSARAAFGNVLHIDIALPTRRGGEVRGVQLLVKSRTSF